MFLGLAENYVCSCFQFFLFLIAFYLFCMHALVWVRMCQGIYLESVTTFGSQFSPSTTWALRLQPRWASSAFYRLGHLVGPLFSISNTSLCISPICLFSVVALKKYKGCHHSVQHFLQVRGYTVIT